MSRVRVSGGGVFKRYSSKGAAELALTRADWLGRHGVLTPGGLLAGHGRLISFAKIAGRDGLSAIDMQARYIGSGLFLPIVRLHALSPALALPRFDPLAKILPRLDEATASRLQPEVASALEVIDNFPPSSSAIHGDLHAGQFIFDEAGAAWLLDLDDLSEGDPAADVGNFAAHLATSDEFGRRNPQASLSPWLRSTLEAYGEAGGHVSPALAGAYGRLALIRRALKFHERRRPELLEALCRGWQV